MDRFREEVRSLGRYKMGCRLVLYSLSWSHSSPLKATVALTAPSLKTSRSSSTILLDMVSFTKRMILCTALAIIPSTLSAPVHTCCTGKQDHRLTTRAGGVSEVDPEMRFPSDLQEVGTEASPTNQAGSNQRKRYSTPQDNTKNLIQINGNWKSTDHRKIRNTQSFMSYSSRSQDHTSRQGHPIKVIGWQEETPAQNLETHKPSRWTGVTSLQWPVFETTADMQDKNRGVKRARGGDESRVGSDGAARLELTEFKRPSRNKRLEITSLLNGARR